MTRENVIYTIDCSEENHKIYNH